MFEKKVLMCKTQGVRARVKKWMYNNADLTSFIAIIILAVTTKRDYTMILREII